jgi:hypothetical protein
MGVTWGKPRTVKEGTKVVVNAPLPQNKAQSDDLFTLYKNPKLKEQIKTDGFSLGKDNYRGGAWQLSYWHDVDDESYVKTKDGVPTWQADFQRKCLKWQNKIKQFNEAVAEVVNVSDGIVEDSVDSKNSEDNGDKGDNGNDEIKVVGPQDIDDEDEPAPPKPKVVKKPAAPVKKAAAKPTPPEVDELDASDTIPKPAAKKTAAKEKTLTSVKKSAPVVAKKPIVKPPSPSPPDSSTESEQPKASFDDAWDDCS